jgi:hypothetical protein
MSMWSWLKLTVFLWLLRKAVRIFGWLLAAAAGRRPGCTGPGPAGAGRAGPGLSAACRHSRHN